MCTGNQATLEHCRDATHHCREKIHETSAQVELKLYGSGGQQNGVF